jgi:hypothetical protein
MSFVRVQRVVSATASREDSLREAFVLASTIVQKLGLLPIDS